MAFVHVVCPHDGVYQDNDLITMEWFREHLENQEQDECYPSVRVLYQVMTL